MKNLLFLLFLFFNLLISNAQSAVTVTYRCIYNIDEIKEKTAILTITNSKSLFKFVPEATQSQITSNEDNDQAGDRVVSLKIRTNDSIGTRFYTDLEENVMVSRELFFQDGKTQPFIIKEQIEKINWEIKAEQKRIGKFLCQNAIGKFRGRIYHAWFIPDIPLYLGPWKLHGLPGLVAEVFDEEKALHIQIQSITPGIVSANSIRPPSEGKEISFHDYFLMGQNLGNNFSKFIQAKLPRGAKFEVTTVSNNSLELTESSNH